MITPVQKLYEVWAGDSELRDELGRSLDPRGTDWLFEVFAALGPGPGDLVLDAGARDAVHTIRLVREHGVHAVAVDPLAFHCAAARERIADAGLTDEIDVVEGALEELPFDDASFDWIWCRDVLVHVYAERGLAECARVLRPGGVLLAYVTLATDRLEKLIQGLGAPRHGRRVRPTGIRDLPLQDLADEILHALPVRGGTLVELPLGFRG